MQYGLALVWLVTLQILTLAGLPIASLLFPRFPDRGAAFALPAALVVVTTVTYWVGQIHFGTVTVLLGVATLAATVTLATKAEFDVRWRLHAEAMVVFTAAFALLLAVRAVDPSVHAAAGEKFLDFGLLKSLLRANQLPPEDMWFAGEPVKYYYGGHLVAAMLAELTATEARYAYNLALAGFYAMLVTAAYGLGGAIGFSRDLPRRWSATSAAFFVGLAGNLATPGRMALGLLPADVAKVVGHPLLAGVRLSYEEALSSATNPADFDYWFARYVIPDTPNVFPLWTFLNGDLRAHMMSAPFLLLVAALCYAAFQTPPTAVRRRRALVFGAIPVTAGVLGVVNTWGLPTACGLTWLTLTFARGEPLRLLPRAVTRRLRTVDRHSTDGGKPVGLRDELARTTSAGVVAALVGVIGSIWALPFLFNMPRSEGIGLFPPRSGMWGLLFVHGAFLLVFAAYFLPRFASETGERPWFLLALVGPILVAGWYVDLAAVALFGPLLAVGWLLARRSERVGFETVLIVAGAGLLLVVEFAYAKVWPYDPNAVRWNTVYKVAMQTWVLWGIAAGVTLIRIAVPSVPDGTASRVRRWLPTALAVSVVLGAGTYGALALGTHFADPPVGDDGATLDALRYVEADHPDEAAAIAWLDEREGRPHVVAAPGIDMYTWVSAPSSLTGLPTVVGWRHEVGYRGEETYERRVDDVEDIYNGSIERRARLLREYDVRYIYVGSNERERYDTTIYALEPGISVAFRKGSVTIYAVEKSELAD